ncbi:hypothetical protein BDV96DRAFT_644554 [Lophiotrema nucula]|uniref:Uncharacterized protein n=1 Tax=Lophiotrema nucula TaxID=690887 RepID=A0A6A5ZCA7_9PLEO|nr:hypothetical protein BDV96DRAFT_644554 [Lophiotrema nucula]
MQSKLQGQRQQVVNVLRTERDLLRRKKRFIGRCTTSREKALKNHRAFEKASGALHRHTEIVVVPALLKYYDIARRIVCDEMQKKLPLELRDTVYSFVTPPGVVYVSDDRFVEHRYFHERPRGVDDNLGNQGFWKEKNIGGATLLEITEYWYRTRLFILRGSDEDITRRFLETDRWQLGLVPKDLVTNVTIECHATNILIEYAKPWYREDLFANLDKLGDLKEGTKVKMDIESEVVRSLVYSAEVRAAVAKGSSVLEQAKTLFAPSLKKLKARGLRIVTAVDGQPCAA